MSISNIAQKTFTEYNEVYKMEKVLFSWIGHADLFAFANASSSWKGGVEKETSKKVNYSEDAGPIKTLLSDQQFSSIYLFSSNSSELTSGYIQWLDLPQIESVPVKLKNPANYAEVYEVVSKNMVDLLGNFSENCEFHILLSPGTPTMAGIWLLIGKTIFSARFWQTYNNDAKEETIPFDITADIIPGILKKADQFLDTSFKSSLANIKGFESIIGDSVELKRTRHKSGKVAIRNVTVLLQGEAGTGKELFAHAIHKSSPRCDKPFIPINCAALPDSLLESELFGYKKGAFSGANQDYDGAFKRAHGGTLFLDEVGECSLSIQAKLLRILQPIDGQISSVRMVRPLKADQDEKVDVRVIAATNQNLVEMIHEKKFRNDLFYRLSVVSITLPPLRARHGDALIIAKHLVKKINEEFQRNDKLYVDKELSAKALKYIDEYQWVGNVRQLYNSLLQACVFAEDHEITDVDIKDTIHASIDQFTNDRVTTLDDLPENFNLDKKLDDVCEAYLKLALKRSGGNKSKAAKILGLKSPQAFNRKCEKFGL